MISSVSSRIRGDRDGMTLIELIVAIALSAILMVSLLGISRRSVSVRNAAMSASDEMRDHSLLIEQLRRDFLHGELMAPATDGVLIRGAIHRDPFTLAATQQLAVVRYQVIGGKESWLIRHQWRIDSATGRWGEPNREIVCRGVSSMRVTSNMVDAFDRATEAESLSGDAIAATSMFAMPSAIQVRLEGADGRAFLDHTIRHHWED